MSIHHRSQAAIDARRQAIASRIRAGGSVFETWLLKQRNRRRRRRGLPPVMPSAHDAETTEGMTEPNLLAHELLGLLVFWTLVIFWPA